jgi:hypothetical protein
MPTALDNGQRSPRAPARGGCTEAPGDSKRRLDGDDPACFAYTERGCSIVAPCTASASATAASIGRVRSSFLSRRTSPLSATLALTSGVPVHIVAARLGDNPGTLLSTYAHLLPQSDELAAETVAAALVSAA